MRLPIHKLGMVMVLWGICAMPTAFTHEGADYHVSADLTAQATHLTVTIRTDIVKQKQAETNGGYKVLKFGKTYQYL